MDYNILSNGIIKTNLDLGNVDLTYLNIRSLVEYKEDPIVYLDHNNVLCLECDFVDRVAVDKVKYYFNAEIDGVVYSGTDSLVASGILFEYKNHDFEEYSQLNTYYEENYYFTKIEDEVFAPRKIRLTHDLTESGTLISGSVYGLIADYFDGFVSFGEDGDLTEKNITCLKGQTEIYSIPIHNNSDYRSSAFVQLKPKNIYLDEYLYISDSYDGPWYSIADQSNIVLDHKNIDLFFLEDNVVKKNDSIQIEGEIEETEDKWASNKKYGVFRSPVFKTNNLYYSNLNFVDDKSESKGTRVTVDDSDLYSTIEVRSSSSLKPYHVYRRIDNVRKGTHEQWIIFEDVSIEDNDTVFLDSNEIEAPIYEYGDRYNSAKVDNYFIKYDFNTGWSVLFFNLYDECDFTVIKTLDSDNHVYKTKEMYTDSEDHVLKTYNIELDYMGGFWLYFYTEEAGSDDEEIQDVGYYLMHFDKELEVTFKSFSTERQIYDIAGSYNSGNLWYTIRTEGILRLIDTEGDIISEFDIDDYDDHGLKVNDLRGCAHTKQGNCWYINGNKIYRIDDKGNLKQSIDLEDRINSGELSYVRIYDDYNLIIKKGDTIAKINISKDSNRYKDIIFAKEVPKSAIITVQKDKGVWVYSMDGYSHFLEGETGEIIYKIGEQISNRQRVPGYIMESLEDTNSVDVFPLSEDEEWVDLDFSKVDLNAYYFPREFFNQVQITLRVNKPYSIYDVPNEIDEWDVEDDFNNKEGYDKPYEHRWRHHEDVYIDYIETTIDNTISGSSIDFSGNVCVFPGHEDLLDDVYHYIDTKNKWYLKDKWDSGDYDFRFGYVLPDTNTEDFILTFKISPIYDYDHSFESFYIRREGHSYYAGYKLHGENDDSDWEEHEDETEITDSFTGYGKMRMKHDGKDVYMYLYNIFTDEWEELFSYNRDSITSTHDQFTFDYYNNFYARIDYQGIDSIYIKNFTKNTGDIYWFFNTPAISKLYLIDAIETDVVYPGNYQNVYLKIDLPKDASYKPEDINRYELRAWWELY